MISLTVIQLTFIIFVKKANMAELAETLSWITSDHTGVCRLFFRVTTTRASVWNVLKLTGLTSPLCSPERWWRILASASTSPHLWLFWGLKTSLQLFQDTNRSNTITREAATERCVCRVIKPCPQRAARHPCTSLHTSEPLFSPFLFRAGFGFFALGCGPCKTWAMGWAMLRHRLSNRRLAERCGLSRHRLSVDRILPETVTRVAPLSGPFCSGDSGSVFLTRPG